MRRSRILFLLLVVFLGADLAPAQTGSTAVEDLKSPEAGTRAKAARELGRSGDISAVQHLAAAVTDPSAKVRREVVVGLASFNTQKALDALITATRDTDSDVRVLAVQGLVGYYTGQIPSTGFVAFWKRAWRNAKNRFVEENVHIDPGVKVDPKVVSALTAAMKDTESIKAARQAADGLGILLARDAVPDLVTAANSFDEDLAVESLNALAKIKNVSAGPKLVNLLESPNQEVKREAAVTLGILRTNEALPKLQSLYENSPDAKTREKSLEGLAYLGNPISTPMFVKALWSSNGTHRTFAAEGLGRAGDPQPMPDLLKAVQMEKGGDAKLAMEFAITSLGRDDFLSRLVSDLGSSRGDSAQNYLVELGRKPEFLSKLYPYLENNDSAVRRRLSTVLLYSGDATSIEPLERLSHDRNTEVASEATRALRAIRARAPGQAVTPHTGANP